MGTENAIEGYGDRSSETDRHTRIILIVEDNKEEQIKALEAARILGLNPVIAPTLEDAVRLMSQLGAELSGIVSDIHVPQKSNTIPNGKIPPAGLAVIADAVAANIPVTVCSDLNHHFADYVKKVVERLSDHPEYHYGEIFISYDKKAWDKSFQELITIMNKHE